MTYRAQALARKNAFPAAALRGLPAGVTRGLTRRARVSGTPRLRLGVGKPERRTPVPFGRRGVFMKITILMFAVVCVSAISHGRVVAQEDVGSILTRTVQPLDHSCH